MKLIDIIKEDKTPLIKRAETIYNGLKKGVITMHVDYYVIGRHGYDKDMTFEYNLGNVYRVAEADDIRDINVRISVPDIQVHCKEDPDLDYNTKVKAHIKTKIAIKFRQFKIHFYRAPEEFVMRNDKWYQAHHI
jgi:hypothetical protein